MKCPRCETETRVYNSRTPNDGSLVYRRRRCPGCEYTFTTYEQFIDDLPGVRLNSAGRVNHYATEDANEVAVLMGTLEREDTRVLLSLARRLAAGVPGDEPAERAA